MLKNCQMEKNKKENSPPKQNRQFLTYSFTARGHPNITAKHRNTLEITKDRELGKEGDCIIGVRADYSLEKIKKIIKNSEKIIIELEINGLKEKITAEANKEFDDEKEIVIRKTDFKSKRTFGIKADKAAKDFSRKFAEELKNPDAVINASMISIK